MIYVYFSQLWLLNLLMELLLLSCFVLVFFVCSVVLVFWVSSVFPGLIIYSFGPMFLFPYVFSLVSTFWSLFFVSSVPFCLVLSFISTPVSLSISLSCSHFLISFFLYIIPFVSLSHWQILPESPCVTAASLIRVSVLSLVTLFVLWILFFTVRFFCSVLK